MKICLLDTACNECGRIFEDKGNYRRYVSVFSSDDLIDDDFEPKSETLRFCSFKCDLQSLINEHVLIYGMSKHKFKEHLIERHGIRIKEMGQ